MNQTLNNYKLKEGQFNTTNVVTNFLKSKNENPTARAVCQLNKALREVYDLLLDEIILNQYTLTLGASYYLEIARKLRNFDSLAVNWGESNKNKKRLLEEGKTPAKKTGVSDRGNPIFDNGHLWMVFYLDDDYIFLDCSYVPMIIHKDGKSQYVTMQNGKKRITNVGALYWTFSSNAKLPSRIGNYKEQNLIKNKDFKLHVRKQNNFI